MVFHPVHNLKNNLAFVVGVVSVICNDKNDFSLLLFDLGTKLRHTKT